MRPSRRELIGGLGAGFGAQALPTETIEDRRKKRGQVVDVRSTQLLVCGGGPAGISAALMAGRLGVKTLLVERYGRVGGMAVQAMVGPIMGQVRSKIVDEIIDGIGGRHVNYETVDIHYARMLKEAGVDILLHSWAMETLTDGAQVTGVRLMTKEGRIDVKADVTIDATGDGDIAYFAGAEYEQGRGAGPGWEADGLMQPMTIEFRVGGVRDEESMEAKGGRNNYRFPDGRRWVDITTEANKKGLLPPAVGRLRTYPSVRPHERVLNATQINGADGTKVDDLTAAEFEGREQALIVLDFLRKHAPGFQDAYISGMPAIVGVRETRRILGRGYLEAEHLLQGKKWADAVVQDASFPLDIHNPSGAGQAVGFSAANPMGKDPETKQYDIPYRCLIPRGLDRLLVAGRCISGSHEALSSYRVQRIVLGIGSGAGAAAGLAIRSGVPLPEVDIPKAQKILFA